MQKILGEMLMRTFFIRRIHRYLLVSFLLIFSVVTAATNASNSGWPVEKKGKIASQFLDKTNLPFSFTYDGRNSREFMANWDISHSTQEQENNTLHTITYTDPVTGLELVSEVTEYKDFPAVEWVHYFKNTSDKNTPILKDVHASDVNFDSFDIDPEHGEVILHRSLGCTSTESDFAPVDVILYPGINRKITPINGRSSNGNMPFFNMEITGDHGAIIAIGWTGQWAAYFSREWGLDMGIVSAKAGMENTHLMLHPGERIRTPRLLFFLWQADDRIHGHNQYRKFIVKYHTPHLEGKPVDLIMAPSSWFTLGLGNGITEQNQLQYLDIYQKNRDCFIITELIAFMMFIYNELHT
jgi:alpha-galactosidase